MPIHGKNQSNTYWTEEKTKNLRELWSQGLSASQIAEQLGGITRNAVIGKVHRLKLSSRGRKGADVQGKRNRERQIRKTGQVRVVRKSAAPAPRSNIFTFNAPPLVPVPVLGTQDTRFQPRPIENIIVPISRRLLLTELSERTCKWPNGDPLTEDFAFCGNDAAETGPYCGYHARIAFQPVSERRRKR